MIICNHDQGSHEWRIDRLGKATASNFKNIIKPSTLTASTSKYVYQVAAERVLADKLAADETCDYWMAQDMIGGHYAVKRGNDMEPVARREYELLTDTDVKQVGFCMADENSECGFSPDGLVGEEGGIEIKCCDLDTHFKPTYENKIPLKYKCQVYGSLLLSERAWWDFISYHEDHQLFIKRVYPTDDDYCKWKDKFIPILKNFIKKLHTIVDDKTIQMN